MSQELTAPVGAPSERVFDRAVEETPQHASLRLELRQVAHIFQDYGIGLTRYACNCCFM
jgi:hypothetical protein